jgi:VWFA-related protein
MRTLIHHVRLIVFLLSILFALHTPAFPCGDELSAMVSATGESRLQQSQADSQKAFKIKVNVALVTTDVMVTGPHVPDLRREDFTIYDNDIAQSVTHFSRGQFPLAVALLIDGSSSTKPYLPMLKIAALEALRRLRPEDQVALFSFNRAVIKHSGLTNNRLAVIKEINKIRGGGTTDIYDSIYDVTRYLSENAPNRRRALILVSDNCHIAGEHDVDSARDVMLEASATLYGIKTSGDSCASSSDEIKWLASETGGEILDAKTATSLRAAMEKAVSRLRLQYTLGFTPADVGEIGSFHRLTVRITPDYRCPGCRVLARSGYFSGMSSLFPSREDDSVTQQDYHKLTDQEMIQLIMLTAATTNIDLADVPFTIKASKRTDSNGKPQLQLDILIDYAGIKMADEMDRRACRLYVGVFYGDAEGNILGSDWKTVQGLLNEPSFAKTLKEGILVSTTIPVKAKGQITKVVVYDEKHEMLGSKAVRLK